jgi:hypothetical protein
MPQVALRVATTVRERFCAWTVLYSRAQALHNHSLTLL